MRDLMGPVVCRGFALAVAAVLFWIAPLAYADPPDPLWVGGVWGDDDFDNVVVVVKSTEVPCESGVSVYVPLEPSFYAPPSGPEWRPILRPVHWPENRAPPDA